MWEEPGALLEGANVIWKKVDLKRKALATKAV